jgi:hypothetical protein
MRLQQIRVIDDDAVAQLRRRKTPALQTWPHSRVAKPPPEITLDR